MLEGEIPYSSEFLPVTPQAAGKLCWEDEELLRGYTWEIGTREIPVESGVGYGIAGGDVDGGILIGFSTFIIAAGRPTTVRHHVLYPKTVLNRGPLTLRHIALLDERQLPIGPSEAQGRTFWDVTLDPGEQRVGVISVPALEAGIHELVVLLIGSPQVPPDEYGIAAYSSTRASLIAGEAHLLPRTFLRLEPDEVRPEGEEGAIFLDLRAHENSRRIWNWPEASLEAGAGKDLTFYVDVGYEASVNDDFPDHRQPEWTPSAVLGFLDYRQVDDLLDIGTAYVGISSDTFYSTLTAHVTLPQTLGRHDLMVVKVNYPGFPHCLLRGSPQGLPFAESVTLQRVGVEVVAEP